MVSLSNDIQERLDVLLEEVRSLNQTVVHLQQEDLRAVFGEQIRPVLMESVERHFDRTRNRGAKARAEAVELKIGMNAMVERYVDAFVRGGKSEAMNVLAVCENGHLESDGIELGKADKAFITDLMGHMREYLEIWDRMNPKAPTTASLRPRPAPALSPEMVEKVLSPLSSSRRIAILLLLDQDSESLADLSRKLDMKKGHLQFHLNSLIDSGYIDLDRRSHLYSLTAKGGRALSGLSRLMGEIETA